MRIAISGTYSTGKSTISFALSHLLGYQHTEAKTMRELLPEVYPNTMLEECDWNMLISLSLLRYRERIKNESRCKDNYVSDGSSIHEWAYGVGRLAFGMRPGKNKVLAWMRYRLGIYKLGWEYKFLKSYLTVVEIHAKSEYDLFIHLPSECDLVKDGHRPLSEGFRNYTDELLESGAKKLGLPVLNVSGTLESRLQQIIEYTKLEPVISIKEAIARGKESMKQTQLKLEELKRRNNNDWNKARKSL